MWLSAYTLERRMRVHYVAERCLVGQQRLLLRESKQFSRMLRTILPEQVINALQSRQYKIAYEFAQVTVMFVEVCDLVSLNLEPNVLVAVLNILYSTFDVLCDRFDIFKVSCGMMVSPPVSSVSRSLSQVETVGEVYMAVGGCPKRDIDHAVKATALSLAMMKALPKMRERLRPLIGE